MIRRRTARTLGATLVVLVGLSGLVSAPLVGMLTSPGGPSRWAVRGALAIWVAVAVVIAVSLAGLRRPPRRQWLLPLWAQHRLQGLVELSAFGVGGLRGWTGANPAVGLDRVRRPSDDDTRQLPQPAGAHHRSPVDPGDPRARPRRAGPTGEVRAAGARPAADPGGGAPSGPVGGPLTGRPVSVHEIRRGETWWSLAERHLGDGRLWTALRDLNLGLETAPGVLIDQDSVLRPGWRINVPAPAGAAPVAWSVPGGSPAPARS